MNTTSAAKKVKLGDITNNLDSKRIPLNERERNAMQGEGVYPYIGANGVLSFFDKYIFDDTILCIAEDGGNWGYNQKCAFIVDERCWVNNHAHVLTAKKDVSLKFLMYYLNHNDLSSFITGTTRGKLTKSALNRIEILLPSFEEQEYIAMILDKAQDLVDKRNETIARLDELVQAVFKDMFGDPVKNPCNFEVVQMESLLDFLTSGSRGWAQHFASAGELFITIKNVKNGKLWLDDVTYVIAPDTKEAERTKVKYRDLLLSITADLGRTAVIDEYTAAKGAYINQHLSILRLNQRCNPYYVAHYLESAGGKIQFASLDQVGVKSGLNFNAIKSLNVILPPIDEQNRFEAVLKKIQNEKEKQFKSLQQLESNFQALLQKAFNGELKVKDGVTV